MTAVPPGPPPIHGPAAWPAPPPAGQHLPPPPSPVRRTSRAVLVGFGVILAGLLGAAGGAIGLVGSANSCGLFADHCSTYGRPAAGADLFATVLLDSIGLVLAGIVVLAVGLSAGRRRRLG